MLESLEIYPWQKKHWQTIVTNEKKNRMHHALLIHGLPDIGKKQFSLVLANYMLCKNRTNHACNNCKDCDLFRAGNHPDFIQLTPNNNTQITIQQVRELTHFLSCHSNQGGYKIVIISPAETLNVYAANALLKLLEEPNQNTLILLVTAHPQRLPSTIVSRCEKICLCSPDIETSKKWLFSQIHDENKTKKTLQLSHGSPLAAIKYLQNNTEDKCSILEQGLIALSNENKCIAEISLDWEHLENEFIFVWMIYMVSSLVRYKMTQLDDSHTALINFWGSSLDKFEQIETSELIKFYDWLNSIHIHIMKRVNINKQILVDALLIKWHELLLTI